jgi:hypothetical protein
MVSSVNHMHVWPVREPGAAGHETFLVCARNHGETNNIHAAIHPIGRADHVVDIIDRRLSSQRSVGRHDRGLARKPIGPQGSVPDAPARSSGSSLGLRPGPMADLIA